VSGVIARLCHLSVPLPGQHARMAVDAELEGPWAAWPAEILLDERVYLHLSGETYLRWAARP
jgi:hypothetical protein